MWVEKDALSGVFADALEYYGVSLGARGVRAAGPEELGSLRQAFDDGALTLIEVPVGMMLVHAPFKVFAAYP